MATSTKTNLDNLVIHKVNTYKTWADNYNQTNGIGVNDLVISPPSFLLPRPFNSSTGVVDNGTSGQFLKTNGNGTVEWANVVALPTQDSNTANKFLKSNGASGAEWADVVALPTQSASTEGQFLKSQGTTGATWEDLPSNLFVCTYGTTTSAQIEEAYQAGKICIVNCKGGYQSNTPAFCILASRVSDTQHIFSSIEWYTNTSNSSNNGPYINYAICENDTWSTAGPRLAPASHATNSTTYGVGNSTNYGHVKLTDNISTSSTSGGYAATPNAVKIVQLDLEDITGVTIVPSSNEYSYEDYALGTDGDIYQCVNSAGTSDTPNGNSSSWSRIGSDLISMMPKITYGTSDPDLNTGYLETGSIYVVYEA